MTAEEVCTGEDWLITAGDLLERSGRRGGVSVQTETC